MPVQHKYPSTSLALAIALALGYAEPTTAQELSEQAEPTHLAEVTEQPAPALHPLTRLAAYLEADTTVTTVIDSPRPALKGISLKPQDRDDLIIVKNGGSFEGRVDGGKGINVLQLDATDGGQLETRNFNGLYVSQGSWALTSNRDFKDGVMVLNDGVLTNNGKIEGGAITAGKLFNKGEIKGYVTVEDGGIFAGAGTVGGLNVSGQFNVDRTHGAPRVKGDLNLSRTGVVAYEVAPDGRGETIKVGGTANLGDSTLKIVAAPGDYPQSSEYTIIEARKVNGKFGEIDNDLAFMTATPHYGAKTVGLTFARNDVSFESVASTDNGRKLGQSIQEQKDIPEAPKPSDDLAPIDTAVNPHPGTDKFEADIPSPTTAETPINTPTATTIVETPATVATPTTTAESPSTASTPSAANNPAVTAPKASSPTNAAVAALVGSDKNTASHAIEQLAGGNNANLAKATLTSDSPISATMLLAMRQLDSASAYSNRTRNTPRLAAGSDDNGRVWLQALGHGGTLDRDNDALQHFTKGLVLGADWRIDEEWRIGVMGGKSETRLDSRQLDGDLDSWHLGAYALRHNGPMSLRLGATYSNHDASTKRRVAFKGFSDRPEGRYDANTQQAFAELGYNLGRANTSIEPFAGLGYQRYQRNSYTEQGGGAALKVYGQTQNNLNSTFGLRLAKLNTLDNGMQLTPRFSASWKHTYGEVFTETRQRLVTGGRDYTVAGASLDRDSLMLDAGLDLGLSTTHTLGVGLTGDVGSDGRNYGVTGQWRLSF